MSFLDLSSLFSVILRSFISGRCPHHVGPISWVTDGGRLCSGRRVEGRARLYLFNTCHSCTSVISFTVSLASSSSSSLLTRARSLMMLWRGQKVTVLGARSVSPGPTQWLLIDPALRLTRGPPGGLYDRHWGVTRGPGDTGGVCRRWTDWARQERLSAGRRATWTCQLHRQAPG